MLFFENVIAHYLAKELYFYIRVMAFLNSQGRKRCEWGKQGQDYDFWYFLEETVGRALLTSAFIYLKMRER